MIFTVHEILKINQRNSDRLHKITFFNTNSSATIEALSQPTHTERDFKRKVK